jgi:hypothetical protein
VQQATVNAYDTLKLRRVLGEMASREREALRLYEPLPVVERFHQDKRDERLVRGGNRSGKTCAAAVEFARAVTGSDPHSKYPAVGRAIAVGLNGNHLGEVMYRELFRAGAFKVIKDLKSGKWRAYRPALDRGRAREAKPAGPLIPPRYVKEIAWEEKKRQIPKRVSLTTGWEIVFYSSLGAPPNGIDVDLWWFDEEIENSEWYPEVAARMLDRKGKGFWSATPQAATPELFNMHLRAQDGDANVGEHVLLLADNPHVDEEDKEKLAAKLTEEERRVRIYGEFALSGFRVYPEYDKRVHNYDLQGPLPRDWTRYVAVDPGRQVCAALFLAVPPPAVGKFVLLYDELYIRNCDAHAFAQGMLSKSDGVMPQAFLIDGNAGRVTEMGSGKNIEMQYSRALKAVKIRSVTTGYGFCWGAEDVKAGINQMHSWLRIGPDGRPYLRVAKGRLPCFEEEIVRYHYRRIKGMPSDEPEKKHDHLLDAARYLSMFDPQYRKPKVAKAGKSYAVRALEAKRRRRARREGGEGGINLGPAGTLTAGGWNW